MRKETPKIFREIILHGIAASSRLACDMCAVRLDGFEPNFRESELCKLSLWKKLAIRSILVDRNTVDTCG